MDESGYRSMITASSEIPGRHLLGMGIGLESTKQRARQPVGLPRSFGEWIGRDIAWGKKMEHSRRRVPSELIRPEIWSTDGR